MTTPIKSAAAQFLQNAGEAVSGALDTGRNAVSRAATSAADYLKSPEAEKLVPYLLAGAGGAAIGGAATGKRKKKAGETRSQYLMRVLRNAAVAGGLGAGSAALIHKGLKSTGGTFDKSNPITGGQGQQGPAADALRTVAFSPVTAAAAGGTALAATRNRPLLGSGRQQDSAFKQLLSELKGQPGAPDSVKSITDGAGLNRLADRDFGTFDTALRGGVPADKGGTISKLRQALAREAGVSMHAPNTARGIASRIIRRPVGTLLGQTGGQRAKRLAIGGGAALIPSLIGALTTDSRE